MCDRMTGPSANDASVAEAIPVVTLQETIEHGTQTAQIAATAGTIAVHDDADVDAGRRLREHPAVQRTQRAIEDHLDRARLELELLPPPHYCRQRLFRPAVIGKARVGTVRANHVVGGDRFIAGTNTRDATAIVSERSDQHAVAEADAQHPRSLGQELIEILPQENKCRLAATESERSAGWSSQQQ